MSADLVSIERSVLGALIESPELIADSFLRYPPQEWSSRYVPVAEALESMAHAGSPISVESLLAHMQRLGTLNRIGGGAALFELTEHRAVPVAALHLLEGLETHALTRSAGAVATRLHQRLESHAWTPEDAVASAQAELGALQQVSTGVLDSLDWPEGDTDPEPEWVIPGLLAEDERLMLTGWEGFGKTMLIRQLVASVAVGRHPWDFTEMEAGKVLHVDLENPQWVSDHGYRRLRNGLRLAGVQPLPGLLHRITPRSFDASSSADVAWLMRTVRRVQPRLIAIGPLKNMSSGNLNDEEHAVKVTNALNRIRAESGAALVVEAHSPHGAREYWRPRGSSSFMAWPEFGLGLKPISKPPAHRSAELVQWRGTRVMGRHWPQYLVESTVWAWTEDPRIEENR